jgi:hypothetical protein
MDHALRDLVWRRAGDRCEYCGMPQSFDVMTFEVDHIIAQKHRGETVAENLALSCYPCNVHKGANVAGLDPQSGALTALFNPRQQQWSEHFVWDRAILTGCTAIGRTTIDVLRINQASRVELRRLLQLAGVRLFSNPGVD